MSYQYQNVAVGTRLTSTRIRKDLIEYLEINGINKNNAVNTALELIIKACQRNAPITFVTYIEGRNLIYEEIIDYGK